MNDSEKTKQFLSEQAHMVLAVVLADGTPWAVPVSIKRWEGNEFEWDSRLDTLHSQAIAKNPDVAVTLFEKKPDSQFGFYAVGQVAFETRENGYGRYRFTAKQCWINDETFVKREVSFS